MPDDNQQGWPNQRPGNLPQVPANRPAPPSPPPPEITIRTLQSDADSLKLSGGSGPTPKTFTPPPPSFPKPPASPLPPPPMPAGLSGQGGPRISPTDFTAPKSPAKPTVSIIEEEAKSGSSGVKKFLEWGGALAAAVLLGVASYLYVFPIFFPSQSPTAPPAVTAPTPTPAPEIPEANVPPAPQPTAPASHQSLLKSADKVSPAQLAATDSASLKAALQYEAGKSNPAGSLTEVAFSDANGQVSSSAALPALLPEFSAETVENFFQDDFTAALYYDVNGAWPAYIFKLNLNGSQVDAQAELTNLEASSDFANLFLADPGAPSAGGFKTGQAGGVATRYLTYSKAGAGLNFAWSGDKLVISTSYNGLKKILGSL